MSPYAQKLIYMPPSRSSTCCIIRGKDRIEMVQGAEGSFLPHCSTWERRRVLNRGGEMERNNASASIFHQI